MLKALLGNKMVVLNLLTLLVSIAAGAGLIKATDITSDQLEAIAGGLVALLAAVNAVAHHRAGRVDMQPDDPPAAAPGNDPSNPVDPGGA